MAQRTRLIKCGIYEIRNILNGMIYIGSSVDIRKRWNAHKRLLKYGKHPNKYLQNSYNKYGKENFKFKILELCDKENIIEREQWYLDNQVWENTYNICKDAYSLGSGESHPMYGRTGKNHPFYGKTHTEETKRKLSKANSGENNPNYGKKTPKEVKEKMSKIQGKPISIDGIIYHAGREAARQLNISQPLIGKRAKNPNFPNYFYVNERKDNEQSI